MRNLKSPSFLPEFVNTENTMASGEYHERERKRRFRTYLAYTMQIAFAHLSRGFLKNSFT